MARPAWLRKAVGEISKLRQSLFGKFGRIITDFWNAPYVLNSSKVDYQLARELYFNTKDEYKLGAGFAKPIINTLAGFMGVPHFRCKDEEAQQDLDEYINRWTSRMLRTHQLALRDGDCYVMLVHSENDDPLYPDEQTRFDYIIIPPEQVENIEVDPITRKPKAYVLTGKVKWVDDDGREREYMVTQKITTDQIVTKVEGDTPEGVTDEIRPNHWGFIPIIHFKNEPEESELHGHSELEPIEPYLKAYHDVMLHAMQGSKMHSTPRLKIRVKDIERFLMDNFPDAYKAFKSGQPAKLDLKGAEVLIFTDEDDADFLEVKSSIGDAEALLKLLFYCIVNTSEVPEFAFGVHMPSSHASVKEQMPILIRRVSRKREMFTENWQTLARMLLVMKSKITGKKYKSYEVGIVWDAIIERDEKEYAETLKTLVDALNTAYMSNLISDEAAIELLRQYIDTMHEYKSDDPEIPGERERIIRSWYLRSRLEDNEGLLDQLQDIEKALNPNQNQE